MDSTYTSTIPSLNCPSRLYIRSNARRSSGLDRAPSTIHRFGVSMLVPNQCGNGVTSLVIQGNSKRNGKLGIPSHLPQTISVFFTAPPVFTISNARSRARPRSLVSVEGSILMRAWRDPNSGGHIQWNMTEIGEADSCADTAPVLKVPMNCDSGRPCAWARLSAICLRWVRSSAVGCEVASLWSQKPGV